MTQLISDLIVPGHPRWEEFVDRLAGPEACNFQDPRWTCFSDLRYTRQILAAMGKGASEIEACIRYFKGRGGYCDCEVLFNVARR